MRKIIASLDIGDCSIKLVIGEIFHNKLNVLSCVDVPSRGIKKGYVINIESATLALQELFDKAEDRIGIRPSKVLVNIPAYNTEFFISEGYANIPEESGKVTGNDIVTAMQSCISNKIEANRELVSVLPIKFILNDTEVVENPLNSDAVKLTIRAVCMTVPRKNIVGIVKCLDNINVKVIDIAVGSLGDYYQFKNKKLDEEVGAVVNIGSEITNVSIFNKGVMTSNEIIDMGGKIIDNDIAYVYKISNKDAIYLKEKVAVADIHMASASESIVLENNNGDKVKINQYDVSDIVIGRLQEILNLVKKQINLLTKKEISYIIITGGVTETLEFKALVDTVFNDAIVGNVNEIGARNNKFATALGLIRYYDSRLKLRNKDFSIYSIEEQEELSGIHKKINISEDSILGKLFGYFFDN